MDRIRGFRALGEADKYRPSIMMEELSTKSNNVNLNSAHVPTLPNDTKPSQQRPQITGRTFKTLTGGRRKTRQNRKKNRKSRRRNRK